MAQAGYGFQQPNPDWNLKGGSLPPPFFHKPHLQACDDLTGWEFKTHNRDQGQEKGRSKTSFELTRHITESETPEAEMQWALCTTARALQGHGKLSGMSGEPKCMWINWHIWRGLFVSGTCSLLAEWLGPYCQVKVERLIYLLRLLVGKEWKNWKCKWALKNVAEYVLSQRHIRFFNQQSMNQRLSKRWASEMSR